MLSIVIPTLDAERSLTGTLDALCAECNAADEIIVVDGGSSDGTVALAESLGARSLSAPRGRGLQLHAGARTAVGDWLLFLHADTRLGAGWRAAVEAFLRDPVSRRRAAYFRFALDDDAPAARRLERVVAGRCRRLGLPYGDQGLLIARGFYFALGGYRSMKLMEDVDLVRRIGRRRLVALDIPAVTSAERYRRGGYHGTSLRNLALLTLYFLGAPSALLARLYR